MKISPIFLNHVLCLAWKGVVGAALGFACACSFAVMPTTFNGSDPVNGAYSVTDPQQACQNFEAFWNKTYGGPRRLTALRWIGFKRYVTQGGFAVTFEGKNTVDVTCTGVLEQCYHTTPTACDDWRVESSDFVVSPASGACPTGTIFSESAQTCVCPASMEWSPELNACAPFVDNSAYRAKNDMCVGKPIYPMTGAKSRSVPLLQFADLSIGLLYATNKAQADGNYQEPGQILPVPAGAGPLWSLDIQKLLYNLDPFPQLYNGNGTWDYFPSTGSSQNRPSKNAASALTLSDIGADRWIVNDAVAGRQYLFSHVDNQYSSRAVSLVAIQPMNGSRVELQQEVRPSINYWRPVPLLKQLKDVYGRTVNLEYDTPPSWDRIPRLLSITDPTGRKTTFDYDANQLLRAVSWPDGTGQQFKYEAGVANKPWLLTSVLDENQQIHAIYQYDSAGRAISTSLAGGANHFSVQSWATPPKLQTTRRFDAANGVIWMDSDWTNPSNVSLTTPSGAVSTITSKLVAGMPRLTSRSQPAGSGCDASTSNQDYDANGNAAWKEDFKGYRTCYAHDLARNVETSRVEGLSSGSTCVPLMSDGATLPVGARRVSTQWHPVWQLQTKVAEPRRLTTKVYNGQPDPFNGGATAFCAPSGGTLPDGTPIAVLCKQVEQATTDTNGARGFSAALDNSVPARVQQWTYNQYGQVLTTKDALNNTTTNEYYSDTTAEHTMGDLKTVTNALNQVVARYTKYEPMGQWLEMVDANGVTTTRTFDARLRLKTTTTAGLTSSYDYWPTGLLKTVTLPDTSAVNYGYDDAHRLTSVTDNLGNKITYTLDNSGNRIGENVTDPAGKLAKTLTRVPDVLNRIQQVSGRE